MLNSRADNAMATMACNDGKRAPMKAGPGRPKGMRNKLSHSFLKKLQKDWQLHGTNAIEAVRDNDPSTYLRVIASLVPKDIKLTADASEPFLDALRMIQGMQPKPEAIAHPSDNAKVIDDLGVDLVVSSDDTIDNDEQDQ